MLQFTMKKPVSRKFITDITFNILAAALPIAMLQLIIYPQVAKSVGGNEYGLMLTIYSIWIMLSNSLGNVLNNLKLLKLPEYKLIGEDGDIALLLRQWIVISSVVVFLVIWIYCGTFSFPHIVIGTLVSLFILLKAYLEVGFRINLNYFSILINNAFLSIGFLIGFLVFRLSGIWEFIFLFGYVFACTYCIIKTRLLSEHPQKTLLYFKVKKDAYSLVLSVLIKNLTDYADKLVLYPLMGGMSVSIYYTATILGKIAGMLTGPINSVILSYIARWDKSKAPIFTKVLLIGLIIGVIGYIIAILFAHPVIGFLFPQWLDAVMDIIPLTTATIMIGIVISILNPFVLKYCKMQWQIGINFAGSIIYFSSALVLWNFMGLKGFCLGTIVGAFVKLMIMIFVYYRSLERN